MFVPSRGGPAPPGRERGVVAPTMIESAASIAPFSPPLTGASSIATSAANEAPAIARRRLGSIELMSITSDPGELRR